MNGAELKATLQEGGRVFGTMITTGRNLRWIPALADSGLDYVIIDTEHNPRSRAELGDYLTMFNTTGVAPIVRIPVSRFPLRHHGHRRGARTAYWPPTARRWPRCERWWRRPSGGRLRERP